MLTTIGWCLPDVVAYAQERMSQRQNRKQIEDAIAEITQARTIEDAATLPMKELEKRRIVIADAARRILLAKIAELEEDLALIDEVKAMVNEAVAVCRTRLDETRETVKRTVSGLKLSKPDETLAIENSEPVRVAREKWERARSMIAAIHGSSNSQQDPHTLQRQIDDLKNELAAYMKTLLGPLPKTLTIEEKVELHSLHTKPRQIVRNSSGMRIDVHTGKAPQIVFASPDEE